MIYQQTFFWMLRAEDQVALAPLMLGDDFGLVNAIGEIDWLSPAAPAVSRGNAVLLLRYEGAGRVISFCIRAPDAVTPERVIALRAQLSPAVAERKWGPFMDRVGAPHRETPPPRLEREMQICGRQAVLRRASHPNPLIDRLMVRDRDVEAAALLAVFEAEPLRKWA